MDYEGYVKQAGLELGKEYVLVTGERVVIKDPYWIFVGTTCIPAVHLLKDVYSESFDKYVDISKELGLGELKSLILHDPDGEEFNSENKEDLFLGELPCYIEKKHVKDYNDNKISYVFRSYGESGRKYYWYRSNREQFWESGNCPLPDRQENL